MSDKIVAVVVAAGRGERFGSETPKVMAELGGKPLMLYCLETLQKSPSVDRIVLVTSGDMIDYCENELVPDNKLKKVDQVVMGGKERQDSVKEGLKAIFKAPEAVLIQDAARPFLTETMINDCYNALTKYEGAIVGTKVNDTIKMVDDNLVIQKTVPRDALWAVQTPQVFRYTTLVNAYQWAFDGKVQFTDDASLVERYGKTIQIIPSSPFNIKITTQEDLALAELILKNQATQ